MRKHGKKHRILKIMLAVLLGVLLAAAAVGAVFAGIGRSRAERAIAEVSLEEMAEQVLSNENYLPLNQLPQHLIDATVSVEDKRFFEHGGVDVLSILRALRNNLLQGAFTEGGSTITQQLAKNLYFLDEDPIIRKIAEPFVAMAMEEAWGKERILELYLNSIYYGEGCYCIGDAARVYFGKDARELDLWECSMLAGLPNAPSVYAPTTNWELARQRQRQVLESMVEQGCIDRATADAVYAEDRRVGYYPTEFRTD